MLGKLLKLKNDYILLGEKIKQKIFGAKLIILFTRVANNFYAKMNFGKQYQFSEKSLILKKFPN